MEEMKDRYEFFEANYIPIVDINLLDEKVVLGERTDSCRFCGKTREEVSFKKIAHAFPELIGNKLLYSEYECDECNEKFSSSIEDHLAKYLSVYRTLCRVSGKKGVPSFKTKAKTARIDHTNGILQLQESIDDLITELDEENNSLIIKTTREPYIPNAVYKCFVKMAITIMPEAELKNFINAKYWLQVTDYENTPSIIKPAICLFSFTPGNNPYKFIKAMLLKRKEGSEKVPYMILIVAFQNFFFQTIIPSEKDLSLAGESLQLSFFPIPFSEAHQFGKTTYREMDFTSNLVVRDDPVHLNMKFDTIEKMDPNNIELIDSNKKLEPTVKTPVE